MPHYDPQRHHRRSIRLKGYDYSQPSAYFITICTHRRAPLFGDIVDGDMILNDAGRVAVACWQAILDHFPNIQLDAHVIMPNHVHGIIVIVDNATIGAKNFSSLSSPQQPERPRGTFKTVGSIVRGFKIGVTKWFRANTDFIPSGNAIITNTSFGTGHP